MLRLTKPLPCGRECAGHPWQGFAARAARRLGLQAGEGVLVAQVKGDAARNAGLQAGDVVLAVGRTDVGSVAALDAQLRAVGTGKPVGDAAGAARWRYPLHGDQPGRRLRPG